MFIKYPRTPHIIGSNPAKGDLNVLVNPIKEGDLVVITEKMDGENTTLYSNGLQARSLDPRSHASRDWVKGFHAQIKFHIPNNMRICGENLYAKHSIYYTNLESFFLGFSVWEDAVCLSWEESLIIFKVLSIPHVPILYTGGYTETVITALKIKVLESNMEGFVVRKQQAFTYSSFPHNVLKFVRPNHVQEDEDHWFNKPIIINKRIEK